MPSNGASLAPHPTPAAWRPLAAAAGLAVLGVLLIAWGRDLSILRRAPLLVGVALSFIALAIGGFRASLLVLLPCTAAGMYFLLDPVGSFAIADPLERVRTVVSIGLTIGVAGLVAWQRVDRRRLRTRERAHRESEQRYRALMDQASDRIFVADEAGILSEVNQRACEMLGYGRDELVGTDVRRLISPESLRAVPFRVKELKERPLVLAEREMVRKDGSRFLVEVSARLMTDGRTQAIARDVTERRAAERSMRQLEARLQHSQRLEALGRLAGGVAHDFNNLLTVIIGNAQIISDSIEDGPTRERAREIHSASERAASLTQQLLAFGRKQAMQFSDVDLNEVVRGFASIARRLAGDVPLELDLDPDVGRVRADVVQLEQVLLNLVVNARDALVGGGTIRVRTRLESTHAKGDDVVENDARPHVVLTVEDDGVGMDAVTQSQMFEPFFTTKPGRGSGLGLSTVYGIVRQSGGHVRVDSAPGRGTTFVIDVPVDSRPFLDKPVTPGI
jgi:PAS domain S-box-containing protein